MCGLVTRSSVLLYNVEFTDGKRISQLSKAAICRAVAEAGSEKMKALLPKTWSSTKNKKKQKSRRR